VREVVDTVRRLTGSPVPTRSAPRRPGDPGRLVASNDKARRELGWSPEFPRLEQIVATAWDWHREHPRGYGG
jgi:UDP-glucose 4-epimerase